jgi:hypothetical protein
MVKRQRYYGSNQPGCSADPHNQHRQPQDLVGVHRKLRINDSNLNIAADICSLWDNHHID